MWASLGSGCEAAAAHGTKLLGLWLFPVPKAPKCLFLLKVGRFCGGIGCAWNDQKLLLLHLSLPGAPCRAALLPQDCPGRAVLGRSWKGCYRAVSTSTQVPGADFCSFSLCVHQPFCLDDCRVSPCILLQSQLCWDMDLRVTTLFHRV